MARILIRRSDGIIQRYKVKASRARQMVSAIESVRWHGLTRKRRVYASVSVMPLRKERVYPTITHQKEYTNSIKMNADRPIHDQPGQVHVHIMARVGNYRRYADGYSHILDLERQYKRGYAQAVDHALSELGYSSINGLYPDVDGGKPDELKVLKTDFVYVIKK